MRYTLTYCDALNVYRLTRPDGISETLTHEELATRLPPNLLDWRQMAHDNPNVGVDWDPIQQLCKQGA